jgi:hypothetical protein
MTLLEATKRAGIKVEAFPTKISVSKGGLSFTIVVSGTRTQVTVDGCVLQPEDHKNEAAAHARAKEQLNIALETLGCWSN